MKTNVLLALSALCALLILFVVLFKWPTPSSQKNLVSQVLQSREYGKKGDLLIEKLRKEGINAYVDVKEDSSYAPTLFEAEAFVQKVNSSPKLKKALQVVSQKNLNVFLVKHFGAGQYGGIFIDIRSTPEEIVERLGVSIDE